MNTKSQTPGLARCIPVLTAGLLLSLGISNTSVKAVEHWYACCLHTSGVYNGDCCEHTQAFQCLSACTEQGIDTHCLGDEACCMENGDCVLADAMCCDEMGGIAAGPGTDCTGGTDYCGDLACCVDFPTVQNDYCENTTLYDCIVNIEGTPQAAETSCSMLDDDDSDDVPDPCDNCSPDNPTHHCNDTGFTCYNPDQDDDDDDGVGDECDNCTPSNPDHHCASAAACKNSNQDDADEDGVGDVCDNCNLYNPDQDDCDEDGIGDECEADCDDDGTPDDCDTDIDGDGILNAADKCDYTPDGLTVDPAGTLFAGTVRADLDGDCDVDSADAALLDDDLTGAGCQDGNDVEETLCPACPACNSCCLFRN